MGGRVTNYEKLTLSGSIAADVGLFKQIFVRDDILRIRDIKVGNSDCDCALLYMDGMVNIEILGDSIVRPIVSTKCDTAPTADFLSRNILFSSDVGKAQKVSDMLRGIMYGDTVLLLEGSREALIINTKGWRTRGISEPQNERILQGPREGFDEAAMLNLAMIRRRLLTPDLCIEMLRAGRRSDTLVFVCYLGSLASKDTVNLLKRRISQIDIDGILDSNYIAEHIRDHKGSLLKTTGSTERPDVVAARLLEGRIALVVDGTPVVLTLPYLFTESFQSDEDYYLNFTVASIGRALRWFCFFAAISAPAIFVALITFHPALLPTHLALAVAELRAGVPMSSITECLALILMFEILKEAGLRMPQNSGHALSIVGGLVVGQAAVEARIISAPMLIVVAFSGISGLLVPRLQGAVFYLRVLFCLAAATLGLYGFFLVSLFFLLRLLGMDSFGVDYTSGLRFANTQSLKDTVFRSPWTYMIKRPFFNKNIIRSRRAR